MAPRRALNWAGTFLPPLGVPRWFALAAALALPLRGLLWWQNLASPLGRYLTGDEYHYWQWAQKIAAGAWLPTEVFYNGPLFPYALAVLMSVVPSLSVLGLAAIQLLLNWITCLMLLPLLRRWLEEKTALAATTLALFFAPAAFFALKRMPPTLGMLLLVAGLLALPSGRGPWGRRSALAGALLGLAVLTVPSIILALGASALFLCLRPPGGSRYLPAGVLLVAAFLVILPATASNYLQDGSLVLVSGEYGGVFAQGNNPQATGSWSQLEGVSTSVTEESEDMARIARREAGRPLNRQQVTQHFLKRGLRFILENPRAWLWLELRKAVLLAGGLDVPLDFSLARERRDFLPLLWAFPVSGTAVLLLASLGVLEVQVRSRLLLPLMAAAALGGTSLLFYVANRYALPFELLLLPAAAGGIFALPRLAARPWKALAFLPVTAAALLAAVALRDPSWEVDYLAKLVSAYNEAGDLPGVAQTLASMTQIAPRSAFVFRVAGDLYRQHDDPQTALLAYDHALQLEPGDRDNRFARATLLWEMGRGQEAQAELGSIVKSDPEDQRARAALEEFTRTLEALPR